MSNSTILEVALQYGESGRSVLYIESGTKFPKNIKGRGMGVANVAAAIESGIRKFDASIGGLGGCPFAPGATGNVATEDVVLMLAQMGFETGIDLAKLVDAVDLAIELTGNCDGGNSINWLRRQIEKGNI